MLYLSYSFRKMRKLDKNMFINDTQVNIVISKAVNKKSYKIIKPNIKKLVILIKIFYIKLLLLKYLCYFII